MNKEQIPSKQSNLLPHFSCPICFELINEATITRCGHTYCSKCIQKSIEINKKCPKCNQSLTTEQTFPNFLLNELISKYTLEQQEKDRLFSASQSLDENDPAENLKTFLASESKHLSLPDVNVILDVLTQRKVLLEAESITAQNKLLHEFLEHLLKQTELQQSELDKKVRLIKGDMQSVETILKTVQSTCPKIEDVEKHFEANPGSSSDAVATDTGQLSAIRDEMKQLITDIGSSMPDSESNPQSSLTQSATYKVRKQKMFHHFDDFVKCYFTNRSEDLHFQRDSEPEQELMITDTNETPTTPSEPAVPKVSKSLDLFRDNLVKFSRYSQLRTLSTLNYSNDNNAMPSTIVSSIEFDKDNEYFAIAGVTKRIKIFDYYACVRDAVVDIKHPINEMVCTSKISCVAW